MHPIKLVDVFLELVAPMDPRELRRAMERQVAAVGLRFDADLGSRILEDVEREPAAMPLLQHALLELWKRRQGRWLRAEKYRAIGGIQQAIAKTAETVYEGLDPAEQKRVRDIFVRLTKPDVDALAGEERRDTRQRLELEELVLLESELEATKRLVKRLADARLIVTSLNGVTGHEEVEMAHEALIRHWPWLRTWLNEERESLRLHARLREAAREWEQRGKPKDRLYRGSQLKEARAWTKRNTPSRNEVAFLRASTVRRNWSVVTITTLFLVLVLTTGLAVQLFLSRPSVPNPTHVTTLHNDGPGSLRQAIIAAKPGDMITFDASLRGTIILMSEDLNITKSLDIHGPGAGILSISGVDKNLRVFVFQDASVTISGLTFKDNKDTGKCLITNAGTLTLTNSMISGNTTFPGVMITPGGPISCRGGGISNTGTLTLTNSMVSGNMGPEGGGFFNDGTLKLINSTVSDNTASGGGNSGTYYGGGIYNGGVLTLINSTVSGNTTSQGDGGIWNGLDTERPPLPSGGTLTLTNSTVSGNSATGNGGGIYNDGTLTNSTVSGNTSTDGGGIFIQSLVDANGASIAQADLTFSTIYSNTAHGGGDIAIEDVTIDSNGNKSKAIKQGSQVKIRNSIVAGDPAHPGPDIVGMFTSYGYTLFQDNSGATFDPAPSTQQGTDKTLSVNDMTRVFASPVVLRENGGPTKTYALLAGTSNPAMNKVPLDACQITLPIVPIRDASGTPIAQYTITTDQRGMKRPDGNEQFCDIGAYEATD